WLILRVHPVPDGADAAAAPEGHVRAWRIDRSVQRYGLLRWGPPAPLSGLDLEGDGAAATPAPVGATGVGRGSQPGRAGSGGPSQLEPPLAYGVFRAMRGSG